MYSMYVCMYVRMYVRMYIRMSKSYLYVNLHAVLYKEYQSLKSRRHVEGSKRNIVPDSRNSVFGVYLNKEKSLTEKKFSFSSNSSTKMLGWSKQSGWTNFKKMPNTDKLSENECKEVNEVCMY